MTKKRITLWLLSATAIGILVPRSIEDSAIVNSGHGRLRLSGYAIAVPLLPTLKLGRWTAHYDNGVLGKEMVHFFGYPASYREYYPDGSLKAEGRYRKGRADGEWRNFHRNGRVSVESVYEVTQAWPISQKIYSETGELIFHSEKEEVLVDKTEMLKETPNQPPEPMPLKRHGSS